MKFLHVERNKDDHDDDDNNDERGEMLSPSPLPLLSENKDKASE